MLTDDSNFFNKCPASNYMFKANNIRVRTAGETGPKLTIKTPEWGHGRPSDVFIINFEHILHLLVMFLLLTLSM